MRELFKGKRAIAMLMTAVMVVTLLGGIVPGFGEAKVSAKSTSGNAYYGSYYPRLQAAAKEKLAVGQTIDLIFSDTDLLTGSGGTYGVSSSKKSVATVKYNEKTDTIQVTGKKAGSATITITHYPSTSGYGAKVKSSIKVTVSKQPYLGTGYYQLTDGGKSVKAKLEGASGTVKYASSDKKVFTVDKKGNIKPVAPGYATLKATNGGTTYKATVCVTSKGLSYSSDTLKGKGTCTDTTIVAGRYTDKNVPLLRVADEAFVDDEKIKSVILPDTLAVIGTDAFAGCTSLTSFEIPEYLISMQESFSFTGLTEITYPAKLKDCVMFAPEIRKATFNGAEAFESMCSKNTGTKAGYDSEIVVEGKSMHTFTDPEEVYAAYHGYDTLASTIQANWGKAAHGTMYVEGDSQDMAVRAVNGYVSLVAAYASSQKGLTKGQKEAYRTHNIVCGGASDATMNLFHAFGYPAIQCTSMKSNHAVTIYYDVFTQEWAQDENYSPRLLLTIGKIDPIDSKKSNTTRYIQQSWFIAADNMQDFIKRSLQMLTGGYDQITHYMISDALPTDKIGEFLTTCYQLGYDPEYLTSLGGWELKSGFDLQKTDQISQYEQVERIILSFDDYDGPWNGHNKVTVKKDGDSKNLPTLYTAKELGILSIEHDFGTRMDAADFADEISSGRFSNVFDMSDYVDFAVVFKCSNLKKLGLKEGDIIRLQGDEWTDTDVLYYGKSSAPEWNEYYVFGDNMIVSRDGLTHEGCEEMDDYLSETRNPDDSVLADIRTRWAQKRGFISSGAVLGEW